MPDRDAPTIRLARPEERTEVERVVRQAYAPWVSRIGREPAPMLDDYAALIAGERVSVLERGSRVEGVLVLIPQVDTLLLDNVAVAPAAHGSGLGRMLLDHAEAVARDSGHTTITLYTNALMTENVALYSRRGYVETERREEKGHRRVYMRKALT